jgi:hypothetical protein
VLHFSSSLGIGWKPSLRVVVVVMLLVVVGVVFRKNKRRKKLRLAVG